jgi:pimeloyl-ACP methyl ester carboxylesterase
LPTLLMIHGLIGSLRYFHPATYIKTARVETCDLLGYGSKQGVPPERLTLRSQAEHVAAQIRRMDRGAVWLLGHSMGGAVVFLLADGYPELVEGVISVEGNFTLKDAFWSSKIIEQAPDAWEREFASLRGDVAAFLCRCGVEPTGTRPAWMAEILDYQPASTVYAMSEAIMKETVAPEYLAAVRNVVERGVPIHLIAGERSAAAWDVPAFVREAAVSDVTQPGAGHLMMLEDPAGFCSLVDDVFGHP